MRLFANRRLHGLVPCLASLRPGLQNAVVAHDNGRAQRRGEALERVRYDLGRLGVRSPGEPVDGPVVLPVKLDRQHLQLDHPAVLEGDARNDREEVLAERVKPDLG